MSESHAKLKTSAGGDIIEVTHTANAKECVLTINDGTNQASVRLLLSDNGWLSAQLSAARVLDR